MKVIVAILVGFFVSVSAHAAATSSLFSRILQDKQFVALESSLAEAGFVLNSLSDTGALHRCLCYDFEAKFSDGESTITKEIRVIQNQVRIVPDKY